MRRYLSVWMLYVKSSIYRAIGMIVIMAALQTALFWYVLRLARTAAAAGEELCGYAVTVETVFLESRICWVFAAAFVLLSVVLMGACTGSGSVTGYTLRRLRISDKGVFLAQTAANACFYLLLLAAEILVTFALASLYTAQPELYVTNQTIPLAYYRDPFLHGLLPLSDWFCLIRNVLMWLGLSVAAACYPVLRRRGKVVPEAILWIAATLLWFGTWAGENQCTGLVVILVIDAEMLIRIFRKGAVLDEE